MSRKYVLAAGAAALGAAAMGRSGRRSRRIWLGMQGLPNQGRRAERSKEKWRYPNVRVTGPIRGRVNSPWRVETETPWFHFGDVDEDYFPTKAQAEKYAGYLRRQPAPKLAGPGSYQWSFREMKKDARSFGGAAMGRRAERRRLYKTLGGLARAMGGRQQVSLETIFSERANLKGKGWSPIKYNLTYADATEIAEVLGGREYTQRDVRNGIMYGRISDLPYSTRGRIVWNKGRGWSYTAGQDYRAETARIRKLLKK